MTQSEFLALRTETQDMVIHEALGKGGAVGRYVNGGWDAFGEMWDALPINDVTDWKLTTAGDSTGHESHSVVRHGGFSPDTPPQHWSGWRKSPNLAVALALLKAKGIIED